jgi:hypothetical protein
MQWSGPVAKNHQLRLWLLTPSANLVLAFLRVILLAIMIFGLVNMRYWWHKVNQTLKPAAAAVIFVLLVGWQHTAHAEKANFAYPPPEILQQLQERLLEKADCYPQCADMVRMDLTATDESLQFLLEVHAAAKTAVPLPGNLETWLPEAVLLDEKPIKGLAKDTGGGLWALIPEGIHRLSLIGQPGSRNTIQIPIPLTPHRVTVHSTNWEVQGVHPNGTVDAGIQLIRRHLDKTKQLFLEDLSLPPFLNIERVLHLGLNWQISTTIKRLTPPGIPVVMSLPLLKGESVTAAGIQVENGKAIVNMEAQALQVRFTSVLEMAPEIRLQAPRSVAWTETWILDASPIWHCDLSGIPVVHHQDQQGHWRPNWRPWPGERVTISVSRPQAIPGKLVTIDKAQLDWTPGRRLNKAGLGLAVRTSRGGANGSQCGYPPAAGKPEDLSGMASAGWGILAFNRPPYCHWRAGRQCGRVLSYAAQSMDSVDIRSAAGTGCFVLDLSVGGHSCGHRVGSHKIDALEDPALAAVEPGSHPGVADHGHRDCGLAIGPWCPGQIYASG